jgi:hypothetical protein
MAGCPILQLLDISDGGALIETPMRCRPGQREVLILRGNSAIKVAGWVVRAEIARLAPCMYRSAVRFGAPVAIGSLGWDSACSSNGLPDRPRSISMESLHSDASRELQHEFTRRVRGLRSVHAVRVSFSLRTHHGTESVHFAVPDSTHGNRRKLQVFFHPETSPTTEEFTQLRQLAVLASGLPDIDIAIKS